MNVKVLTLFLVVGVAMVLAVSTTGCQKTLRSTESVVAGDAVAMNLLPANANADMKAGALMWSQNCMRCHNLRNPRERSDREWDVIVHHMRVRGNLTAEEHRLILRFLQSAN